MVCWEKRVLKGMPSIEMDVLKQKLFSAQGNSREEGVEVKWEEEKQGNWERLFGVFMTLEGKQAAQEPHYVEKKRNLSFSDAEK